MSGSGGCTVRNSDREIPRQLLLGVSTSVTWELFLLCSSFDMWAEKLTTTVKEFRLLLKCACGQGSNTHVDWGNRSEEQAARKQLLLLYAGIRQRTATDTCSSELLVLGEGVEVTSSFHIWAMVRDLPTGIFGVNTVRRSYLKDIEPSHWSYTLLKPFPSLRLHSSTLWTCSSLGLSRLPA